MRLLIAVLAAAACTSYGEPPPPPSPSETLAQVRAPRDTSTSQISGVVAKRQGGAVMLDSGGPNPVPLRIDGTTQVVVDGQKAQGAEIREGDLVRAAYRLDDSGEPLALQVVANSRPPPHETVTAPPSGEQSQSGSQPNAQSWQSGSQPAAPSLPRARAPQPQPRRASPQPTPSAQR